MHKTSILLASLLLLTSTCWAGETASATDKPSMSTSETVTITALVEAINHETREVTLRGPEGNTVSFVASEEARNLDQVEAGDIVMAEYVQSMSIEVMANDGFEPGAGEISALPLAHLVAEQTVVQHVSHLCPGASIGGPVKP